VLALFSDSTNVERPGFTPSERAVVPRIEELCRSAPRRVILSCFASSIHRIQQVIDIASRVNRKIAFVGRSMVDNVEIAHSLELLRIPDGMVVRQQDIRGFDPKRIIILASGTQAEPMSSLSRIAVDNHRFVSVDENDSVILSARIIPEMKNPFSACWTTCSGAARWFITIIPRESSTFPVTRARKNKNSCYNS